MKARHFRKSDRAAIAAAISEALARHLTVEKVETLKEVIHRGQIYRVTGREKIILTVREI